METVCPTASPDLSFSKLISAGAKKICFVCTGNTCRSPMAAAVLNHLGRPFGIKAVSAGLYPTPGAPISENARLALEVANIPAAEDNRYDRHTARTVERETVAACDRIVGITDAHTMSLIGMFPDMAMKIISMPESIPDPYGGTLEDYKTCLAAITAGIKELFLLND